MRAVVQATCPGCKKVLRLPADWVNQPLRCKHCGATVQAKGKSPTPITSGKLPSKPVKVPKVDSAKQTAEPSRVQVVEPVDALPALAVNEQPAGLPHFSGLSDFDSQP